MKIEDIFNEAGLGNSQICWNKIRRNRKLKSLLKTLTPDRRLELYEFLVSKVDVSAEKYVKMTKSFHDSAKLQKKEYTGNYVGYDATRKSAEMLLMHEVKTIMEWFDKLIEKKYSKTPTL